MNISKAPLAAIGVKPQLPVTCGFLQHGDGHGPFRTEKVQVKQKSADCWMAKFEGRWRRVHHRLKKAFIVFQGERIAIQMQEV